MNKLEQYLNAATRGLWGKRKLEVREEFEAHVLERALRHELLGLAREAAILQALSELGSARVIRSGLQRTYSAKPIFSLILLGLVFLGFTAFPSSEQQRFPILDQSLKVNVIPIPLARAGMARTQPIPLSKPGDTNFAPIPLAKQPSKVPVKSR